MNYSETKFFYLKDMCINNFGEKKGNDIYLNSNEKLAELIKEADYRNNKAIEEHMVGNMLPTIAYYLTLLNSGFSKEDSYNYTLEMTQKAAQTAKKQNEKLGKMKLAYLMFKLSCKKLMTKNFPKEGWETEWVTCNSKEIHMNFKRCISYDTTCKYNCPELCTVFCKNDITVFEGYKPSIIFERNGTIAEGKEQCDFHFLNSKHL